MGFRILIIVLQVRRSGRMKIKGKILSEILKTVCGCGLKEIYLNLP